MVLPEPPPAGTTMLPPGCFAGHVVVVTGGGTGLGKAIALEFARLGAEIGILSRSNFQAGVDSVQVAGGRAIGMACDVREPVQVGLAFEAIELALGPVSVLVNNAAANFPVPAASLSLNGWRAVTDIVLDGTFICAQEFHKRCVSSGRPGAVLNIATTASWTGGPGMAHSAAAKAGVVALTKTLAVEWAADGVRVNALAPGLFPHEDLPDAIKAARDPAVDDQRQPAGRVGRVQELGWAATYLCSSYANFITGHTLVVDGGNWLRRDFAMPPVTPITDQLRRRSAT